ncbi:hypothetical protein GB937_006705 [Aspergillus fischeri]|nr:hypothetical protein GB937_006705 [Aspergillus fischeri]
MDGKDDQYCSQDQVAKSGNDGGMNETSTIAHNGPQTGSTEHQRAHSVSVMFHWEPEFPPLRS